MSQILDQIRHLVDAHPVVLFMKGTKDLPRCGFSATVVQVLENLGVSFLDVDVLASDEMRQGIKDFTNWPTIPQLYIKGEFIGGCDITRELYQSGELKKILTDKNILAA